MTLKVRENKSCHKAALRSYVSHHAASPCYSVVSCAKHSTQSLSEITTLLPICTRSELSRKKRKKDSKKPHTTDKELASTDVNSDLNSHISFPGSLCCTKSMWTCIKFSFTEVYKKNPLASQIHDKSP